MQRITPNDIRKKLTFLEDSKAQFLNLSKEMMEADSSKMYPLDLLMLGIVNRSLLSISGFISLIENKNFISAAVIIRLHIDNLLQLYSAFIVRDPHKFALDKMGGKHSAKIKDRLGNSMSDSYLMKTFLDDVNNSEFLELKDVYIETSGFVHFSNKHIFSSFNNIEGNNFEAKISDKMENIPLEKENEAIETMILITRGIFKYLIGWIHTKNNPLKNRP